MMNLLQLEYFRELACSEHMQKTAKKLHVSAPAVSAGLRNMESELGVALFDHVGRNMRLNDCGKALLPYVEQLFLCLRQGREAVDTAYLRHKKRVAFSVKDAAFWSELIEMFNLRYPDILLFQHDADPEEDGKLLNQCNLDFMVTDKELKNKDLDRCVLYEDRYVLLVSAMHPMAARKQDTCSLFDLDRETFLFRPKSDYFQQCTDRLFSQFGFTPANTMEFEYILRSRMLSKNIGVAVTTERAARLDFYSHAAAVRVREFDGIKSPKKLYWKKDQELTEAALTFKTYVTRVISTPETLQAEWDVLHRID
jgi:DNA-binding transcriptional LysR family regulator